MAADELVGNIATETIVATLEDAQVPTGIDQKAFAEALVFAEKVF